MNLNKTYLHSDKDIKKKWYLIDAKDMILGRLAVKVATILMGKHKPNFINFKDTGDFVIIINADKVKLSANKENKKVYYRHSGYPGGLKVIPYKHLKVKFPERIIKLAVSRMLPKNKLRKLRLKKLKVYAGNQHPHQAQKPEKLEIKLKER